MKKILITIFAVTLFLPLFTHAAVVNKTNTDRLKSGLIGYWTMDGADSVWTSSTAGTVVDKSGNGKTGTFSSMVQSRDPAPGRIGQGMKFYANGADSKITTASLGTQAQYSMSFWAKKLGTHPQAVGRAIMVSAGDTYIDACVSSQVRFSLNTSVGGQLVADGGTCASTGVWTHFVGTYDGALQTLYVNGVQVAQTSNSGNVVAAGVTVGQYTGSLYNFNGVIDDVRIYNRALSAAEITQLYNLGGSKMNTSRASRLTTGLAGYWTFDGKDIVNGVLKDVSGNGRDANLKSIASTTFYAAGKIGQAGNFDGVNDFATTSSDFLGTGPLTISVWLYPEGAGGSANGTVISNSQTRFLIASANRLTFDNDSGSTGVSGQDFPLNQWRHAVVTRDAAGTTNFYSNGVLSGAADQAAGTPVAGQWVVIGNRPNSSNTVAWDGMIDDLRVYNRILTTDEITDLYNLGARAAAVNTSLNSRKTTGLIGLWSFDGADLTASAASDRSGSGNTGTLSGFATIPLVAPGKIGQALKFDGVGTGIDMGDTNEPSVITLSAWVKPNSIQGGKEIISKGGTVPIGGSSQYGLSTDEVSTDKFTATFNSSALSQDVCTSTGTPGTYVPRIWTFVVATYDGTSCKIYVNGVDATTVVSDVASGNLRNTTSPLRVGKTGNSSVVSTAYFDGVIDDVRIYSTVLTPQDITRLYNLGR